MFQGACRARRHRRVRQPSNFVVGSTFDLWVAERTALYTATVAIRISMPVCVATRVSMPPGYKILISLSLGLSGIYCPQHSGALLHMLVSIRRCATLIQGTCIPYAHTQYVASIKIGHVAQNIKYQLHISAGSAKRALYIMWCKPFSSWNL